MEAITATSALQIYAICSAILGMHLIALALWTGTVRVLRKTWINAEDARLNKGTQAETDHPDVQRAKRAHMNAIENAIPFFVIGYLYVLTAPSATAATLYFATFTGARLLHSVFYLLGRQPFRTLMFVAGVLATLGMGVKVLIVAL